MRPEMVLIALALAGFIALSVWNSRRMTSEEKASEEVTLRPMRKIVFVVLLVLFLAVAVDLFWLFWGSQR
jgi:hypothetical protein